MVPIYDINIIFEKKIEHYQLLIKLNKNMNKICFKRFVAVYQRIGTRFAPPPNNRLAIFAGYLNFAHMQTWYWLSRSPLPTFSLLGLCWVSSINNYISLARVPSSFIFHAFKSFPTLPCCLNWGLPLTRFTRSIFITTAPLTPSLSFLLYTYMTKPLKPASSQLMLSTLTSSFNSGGLPSLEVI